MPQDKVYWGGGQGPSLPVTDTMNYFILLPGECRTGASSRGDNILENLSCILVSLI